MSFSFIRNPVFKFLSTVLLLNIVWYFLYTNWLHPQGTVDQFIIDISISLCKWILENFGYIVFTGEERTIGIDGTSGLWIGDSCNGISLFALFSGFVIAYKGNIFYKLIYIPIGIILIQIFNVIRLVTLSILETKSRSWTEFNHTYTFTILIYAFIFWLWIVWVNRFSDKQLTI